MKIQSLFRNKGQFQLFLLLCLSTLFNLAMIVYRMFYTRFDLADFKNGEQDIYAITYGTFFFLVWNLFLAWIPYCLSLVLDFINRFNKTPSVYIAIFLIGLWLLFLPNAPYLVTDIQHFRDRHVMPYWYDLMLFVSFAWTGLMLGYASLFEVQHFLENKLKKGQVAWIMFFFICLCAFGVYMGRFQRWNSWDIFNQPLAVLKQQINILINPLDNLKTFGVSIILSIFLSIGYWTLNILRGERL
jgi:uncharacterized membrane protein